MSDGGSVFGRRHLDSAACDRLEAQYRLLTVRLDAALDDPTDAALDHLEEATDGLMRAAAAIRLAVERLRAVAPEKAHGSRPAGRLAKRP